MRMQTTLRALSGAPLFLAAAALLLFGGVGEAQQGTIRGEVVDEKGIPVADADVLVMMVRSDGTPVRPPRRFKTNTDDEGKFTLVSVPSGNYRITLSKDRYVQVERGTNVLEGVANLGVIQMENLAAGAITEQQAAIANVAVESAQKAYERGDYATAIAETEKFLEIDDSNPNAWFNLAGYYEKAGEKEKALETYRKVVEMSPNFVEAWVAIASIHGESKQYKEAMEAMGKAAEIRKEPVYLFNWAAYATNADDMATAEKAFKTLLEVDPNHAIANFQLALMMVSQERKEEAIQYLEKYLEVDPEGAQAATAKDLLEKLKQS